MKRRIFLSVGSMMAASAMAGNATTNHFARVAGSGQLRAAEHGINTGGSPYPDGRPWTALRMNAVDHGIVLRHGDTPGDCDRLGARDVWVFEADGLYYMHYDGAGADGWLCCQAMSDDLVNWTKHGPVLDFGAPGTRDFRSASYGTTFFDGETWHMFYLGTPNVSPAPDFVPSFPYLTLKARSNSPAGPWTKQPAVTPFAPQPGTYYSVTASPGQIVHIGDEYRMFFSASTDSPTLRTLGIARTRDLNGTWTIDPEPIVPLAEQIENSSLYFEPESETWFLFTNHVGLKPGVGEYTDAIWVYWSKDPDRWNPDCKAVVLDGANCEWSRTIVGLPSVVRIGDRLAIFYDGREDPDDFGHMRRHIGLAWLPLPLRIPTPE